VRWRVRLGMALGGGDQVFGAVVADLDRMAGLHREQRRVRADDGGEVFLAAEGPAGLGLDDAALFGGQIEDELERVDEVVGALHGAGDGDGFERAVGRAEVLGDDAVVLDVELLLRAGAVLAFDDEVGTRRRLFQLRRRERVALLHEEGLEGVGGVVAGIVAVPDDFGGRRRASSESSMVKTPGSSS
jgi:hypothetical protein